MAFHLDLMYSYVLKRSEFGKPLNLKPVGPRLVTDIEPVPDMLNLYVNVGKRNFLVQAGNDFTLQKVNTNKTLYKRQNENHVEGSWPKEIAWDDYEMTTMYRKRIEKDEVLNNKIDGLVRLMEGALEQNIQNDIYQEYFTPPEWTISAPLEEPKARIINRFKDGWKVPRPCTALSWSPTDASRLAVAHANLTFQGPNPKENGVNYIYYIENPNAPEMILFSEYQCCSIDYNHKNPELLAGGVLSGQVLFWDIRKSSSPVATTYINISSRSPPTSLLWTNSKTGTEVMSASSDGQIIWWDLRNLSEPVEKLLLDFTKTEEPSFSNAMGVSCLEYEHSIPTKFMVGTECGYVLSGNRKGKTIHDKIGAKFHCHYGCVLSCERNPGHMKNFITAGDWEVKIWSEDCKESAILWTGPYDIKVTSAIWSKTKYSTFFVGRHDGYIDIWDLIIDQNKPVITASISDVAINCMNMNPNGSVVAAGDKDGTVYLIELSDHFQSLDKLEKLTIISLYERESKRERLIEGKIREMKLKASGRVGTSQCRDPLLKHYLADNIFDITAENFFQTIKLIESGKSLKKKAAHDDDDYN